VALSKDWEGVELPNSLAPKGNRAMIATLTRISGHRNLFHSILYAALTLLFLFFTLGAVLIGRPSLTYDEPVHFRYGAQVLDGNAERFDGSKMPFSVLNVAASRLAVRLLGERIENDWQAMSAGRIATIVFSLGLGLLSSIWATQMGGRLAGLVAFGLFVFEPNVLAHSSLITTDIYAAGSITLTLFVYWRFLKAPNAWRAATVGLALGLAQIAKYTSLLLFPILVLLAFLCYGKRVLSALSQRPHRLVLGKAAASAGYGLLILTLSILVINAGFLFQRTGTRFGNYEFTSLQFQRIQAQAPFLSRIPVPVPYPYLQGLDIMMFEDASGSTFGRIYLLGELHEATGFPGYFLVASLFKVPLGLLALFGWSLVDWLQRLRSGHAEWDRTYLLVPALVFELYLSFFLHAQIGLRYSLVVFPVLLIFTAQVVREWERWGWRRRLAFAGLCAYLAVSVVSSFPQFIPYFNELVPDRRLAYRILADSNISWGQNGAEVQEALAEHPEYILEPDDPTSGMIVVDVNRLTGVLGDPETFRWLRDNFEPDGTIGYAHLIFDVSDAELQAALRSPSPPAPETESPPPGPG